MLIIIIIIKKWHRFGHVCRLRFGTSNCFVSIPPKYDPSVRVVATWPSLVRISTTPSCMKYILSPTVASRMMMSPGWNTWIDTEFQFHPFRVFIHAQITTTTDSFTSLAYSSGPWVIFSRWKLGDMAKINQIMEETLLFVDLLSQ